MKAHSFGPLLAVAVVTGTLMLPSCDKKADSATSGVRSGVYTSRLDYEVTVKTPKANAKVISPLKVSGVVRGPWTYDAKFPVEVVDAHHKSLAKGQAKVLDNWMTEGKVRFAASIRFK